MAGGRRPSEVPAPVELIDSGSAAGPTWDPLGGEADDSAGPIETTGRVDGRPGRGRTTLATVAGAAVVVGLLWLLGRAAPPDAGDGEAAAPTTTTVPPPSVTRLPAPTTSEPVVVADAPVLGEPSDLLLFYGGDGPLQSVDLDSGVLTRYGLVAHPVLATGRVLVLHQEEAGIVGWVPLDDPGQQALTWKRGQVAPGSGPGLLWVLDPTTDEPHEEGADVGSGRWELFDVVRNRISVRIPADLHPEIEEPASSEEPLGGIADVIRPGPFFSTRPDGVYLSIEGGFRKVADGRLLAHDLETALVGTCPADATCDLRWIETVGGTTIDRPLPGIRPRVANLVAGGAWLHSIADDGTSELLELATGRRIKHNWPTDRPTLSPDGRWLAEWFGTTVVLSDLGGNGPPRTVGWVADFEADGPGSLLFVRSW
ncbi:MAG: hypothetical protein AAGA93_09955 [Actinomycetota bacterium]